MFGLFRRRRRFDLCSGLRLGRPPFRGIGDPEDIVRLLDDQVRDLKRRLLDEVTWGAQRAEYQGERLRSLSSQLAARDRDAAAAADRIARLESDLYYSRRESEGRLRALRARGREAMSPETAASSGPETSAEPRVPVQEQAVKCPIPDCPDCRR